MPRLKPVKWRVLIQRLQTLGFEGPYGGGRHPYMVKGDLVLTIPNPHRDELSADLLARLLRQAGVTRQEWDATA